MPMIEWEVTNFPVPYEVSVETMEQRAEAIRAGTARELVWLLEHPPIYTRGTSASDKELLRKPKFPVFNTGRGGRYTYHGPGQRVIYVMLDLRHHGSDVRSYVQKLEQLLIDSLADCGINAERRSGRIGIWVSRDNGCEEKIGAIGVRIRRWVSFHGASLNVDPNLGDYNDIIPCGVSNYGVTSICDLGLAVEMSDVDSILRKNFENIFGATVDTNEPIITNMRRHFP